MARVLRTLGVSADTISDVVQAASELVNNAVLHGAPPIRATLHIAFDNEARTFAITFEVYDHSPIPTERADASISNGFGLKLVRALTDELGVTSKGQGKTVWFTKTAA